MNIIDIAAEYAIKCHRETNHKYDGKPYEVHLDMVKDFALKYIYLIPKNTFDDRETVVASCWTHDVIEDCRQTYNDVKKVCGETVAEITYALTNEKGKTREERANIKYYEGIEKIKNASFVKICDRLANVKYSKETNSRMFEVYKKEHFFSKNMFLLWRNEYAVMFEELDSLLK